ncbi:hypothetical protein IMZ48_30875 [Candidatus Bathyarchaeota archaeon]|nr:hypothetical protein [Candidatus Bathyarchaeota archaeon]
MVNTPITGTSQGWREYETLSKDMERQDLVRLETLKRDFEPSSRPVRSPHDEPPWARGW